jgi:hypothetical protein
VPRLRRRSAFQCRPALRLLLLAVVPSVSASDDSLCTDSLFPCDEASSCAVKLRPRGRPVRRKAQSPGVAQMTNGPTML